MTKAHKLSDLIRGEMKRKKVRQAELGYYVGLTQSEFSRRLAGKDEWKLKEIIGIAEYLGIGGEISEILF